ncbi:WD40-repeat-containing domain protein [Dichotomocladium elegans]|nr:WD40-repeat-containing domain protein [Dichotomocladium elegans]
MDLTRIYTQRVKDKKLKNKLKQQEDIINEAVESAARAELLLTEEAGFLEAEGIEKTFSFRQDQLAKEVDINTAKKIFTLDLPQHGPYCVDYTRNGRHLLIGGKRGHLAAFDWQTGRLHCELHVNELVRDVKWLHNETLFAVAQKQYVFIYDKSGLEVHRLKHHQDVNRLEYLPYHHLLSSVGNAGYLKYQDTSTGQFVAELRTRLGSCHAMTQNPWNAILHLGHANGTVTLWSPNSTEPLVKMLCHRGPIQAVAVDQSGRYMATSGLDGQLKLWDIRKYEPLHEYRTHQPATSLSISQRGLLAVGWSSHVTVWKDCFRTKQTVPYMNHLQPASTIRDLHFVPYEDVLGFGHAKGVSSIVIPGAGEPNFDTLEANPYQTLKQRQEAEVHGLLDKLQPDMIVLDPTQLGKMTRASKKELLKRRREEEIKTEAAKFNLLKKKAKRHALRQRNVVDPRKVAYNSKDRNCSRAQHVCVLGTTPRGSDNPTIKGESRENKAKGVHNVVYF